MEVALTFDACMTPAMLDNLKKEKLLLIIRKGY